MMMMMMVVVVVVLVIIIIKRMPLETKFSRSAHWQFERSSQYPLIVTLEVIEFKDYIMHFCGRGGFRFSSLSYLQINVVPLVHSDCRLSCPLLLTCLQLHCATNTKAQPSFCCFLFAPSVFLKSMLSFNFYRSSFFSFDFASFFHVLFHPLLFLRPLNSSTHHSFPSSFALPPSPSQSTSIHFPSSSPAFFPLSFPSHPLRLSASSSTRLSPTSSPVFLSYFFLFFIVLIHLYSSPIL